MEKGADKYRIVSGGGSGTDEVTGDRVSGIGERCATRTDIRFPVTATRPVSGTGTTSVLNGITVLGVDKV